MRKSNDRAQNVSHLKDDRNFWELSGQKKTATSDWLQP